ncbi:hypothetical protein BH23ACT9_BH23ACT9_37850 [soil metagenome]
MVASPRASPPPPPSASPVGTALTDPSTAVVVTRLRDGHVHLARGWPADLPPGHEPVLTGPGVVAVLAEDDLAGALAEALGEFTDARAAMLTNPDGHGLLAAVAFGQWRARTRFCPRCGGGLAAGDGGRVLRCKDGHQEFPRLEPAVIMRVVDADDRIVLARQVSWPEGRVSVLAGFVDPGEALEDTVRREVMEEVGVTVGDVAYVKSQPWPFPSSLMLAFEARATSTQLQMLDGEIADAAWFSRDELRTAMAEGAVALPPPLSVAHQLVHAWLDAPLRIWGS